MEIQYVILAIAALVAIGGAIWFMSNRSGDVRKIEPSKQDRARSAPAATASRAASAKTTTAKTAQLSALRDKLAATQSGAGQIRKMPQKAAELGKEKPWSPEEAGLSDSAPVFQVAPEKRALSAPTQKIENLAPSLPVAPSERTVTIEIPRLPELKEAPASVPPTPVPSEPMVEALPSSIVDAPTRQEIFTEAPVAAPVAPPEPAGKPHILLVDDSKVVRVRTEKLLLSAGYAVSTAVDGIDALSKLETFQPDVIITDIEMPNLDGFGLVRNIRGNERTEEIPIIVMTSHVNLHLDIAATEGINGFLPKPFNDPDLLDQVAFLVEK